MSDNSTRTAIATRHTSTRATETTTTTTTILTAKEMVTAVTHITMTTEAVNRALEEAIFEAIPEDVGATEAAGS